MSPQNPQLLYFLALVGIPVLLHFLLRAKPKKLLFPALQLIQRKKRANRRRMRLRHLLLLLLRIAVIALIVIGLARPTVPATDYTPSTFEIATALLILAAAVGVYFAVMHFWKKKGLPTYELAQRVSYLRGGVVAGAVFLLLLLVAWPFQRRIAAAITQPTIQRAEKLPVAAVFLFDTSLSMDFRYENKTRLQRATDIASAHLSNLPRQSEIAICDTKRNDPVHFSPDRSIAQEQITGMTTSAVSVLMNDRIRAVIDLQINDMARLQGSGGGESEEAVEDPFVRELYIFTDLAAHAWQPQAARMLQNELERLPSMGVYLIDVGIEDPANTSITDLKLSSQTVSQGGVVSIDAAVTAVGADAGRKTVEIFVESPDGELIKQGSSEGEFDATASRVSFALPGLTGPVVQGEMKLVTSDSLPFDDVGYFTVEVRPPKQVLIVSDVYSRKAMIFKNSLSPDILEEQGDSPYRCTVIKSDRFETEDLSRFDVVCWLDVSKPTFSDWRALRRYLEGGGGVVLVLGPSIDHAAYLERTNAPAILPADLLAHRPFDESRGFDLRNLTHPLLKEFVAWDTGELSAVAITRAWRTEPAENANVILPFTDAGQTPALIERPVGQGRVLMLTTPFDRSRSRGQEWNNLVISGAVPLILADQMVQYVSANTDERYNYIAGQVPTVKLPQETEIKQLLIRKPDRTQPSVEVPVGAEEVLIEDATLLGQYRILPRDADVPFQAGLSINAPASESDLARLTTDDLNLMLGEGRYEAARDIDGLTRQVRAGRVGREIFPWLVALMIAVFLGEHFIANYFYDTDSEKVAEAEQEFSKTAAA